MISSPSVMPDGTTFPFWEDETEYRHIYHVACQHPAASDDNPGTQQQPFATINRAAQLLQPGEKVIVHEGVYRECVRPARGGTGPAAMIAYQAAPGETVIVRGSEAWQADFTRGAGWLYTGWVESGAPGPEFPVWAGDLPAEWFVGYNPFVAHNFSSEYTTFTRDWTVEENHTFLLRRGMLFADGRPLRQVHFPSQLAEAAGTFWVEDPGLRLHIRLWEDADPQGVKFEVTAREQVFAPLVDGLGYIRVSGFHFEYAADGIPVPQRAMLSASRGHHWIIEENDLRWANAVGLDVGNETWHRRLPEDGAPQGHHILRRNHVSDCGVCGMAAVGNNACTLVEDNLIERIGGLNVERIWEAGGLKFHTCDTVLIRNNVFRHIRSAPGLWLDYLNHNSRVTGNVFADIESIQGGIFIEVSHAPNLVDHNLLWDIRRGVVPGGWQGINGPGINIDTGEACVVAHNLLGKVPDGYAILVHMAQKDRVVAGRVGLCRRQQVLNNLLVDCPKRILISRTDENICDGNLFDEEDDSTSLCVEYPAPKALLNLAAWQSFCGFDRHGAQTRISASFDSEKLELSLEAQGDVPQAMPVEALHEEWDDLTPGPVKLEKGRNVYQFGLSK